MNVSADFIGCAAKFIDFGNARYFSLELINLDCRYQNSFCHSVSHSIEIFLYLQQCVWTKSLLIYENLSVYLLSNSDQPTLKNSGPWRPAMEAVVRSLQWMERQLLTVLTLDK